VPGGAPKIRDFGGTANALESVTMDGRKHDRINYRLSRTSTHIGDAFVVSSTIVRQVRADNLKSENERQGNMDHYRPAGKPANQESQQVQLQMIRCIFL